MKHLYKWFVPAMVMLAAALSASASEKSDSTFVFRFVTGDDMFYVPWNGNGAELDRLLACAEQHKEAILAGSIPVLVDGYCTSQATAAENLAMAKTRSNRVKTEMILRGGLTEACFTTKNHAAKGNFVTVRIVIPAGPSEAELEAARRAEAARLAAEKRAREAARKAEAARLAAEKRAEEARKAAEQTAAISPVLEETREEEPVASKTCTSSLALHANLLRWATLTPDLGLEWRINSTWALAVNGSWTSWTWNDNARRYALWEVAPEVRWYLGEKKRGYLGATFKAGQFNYKLSDTGRQGDLLGGGITGGYAVPLGKALSLDFNIGLGYLNADFEKYEVIDGVCVRQGSETKDWWGPVNAGVSLVWKLF